MSNYQNAYQDKVGTARIDIKKAVAGKSVNCRLTYTVGSLGIDDSGALKVLFRLVADGGSLQFEDKNKPNFVKLNSSNKDLKIMPGFRSRGMFGKVHERPWSVGFILNFTGNSLVEGDEVKMEFINWRIQTFCEKTFEMRILVDPFATGRYVKIKNCPEIEIVADKAVRVKVVAPSKVEMNKEFKYLVKLEDKWANVVEKKWLKTSFKKPGLERIEGKFKSFKGISNPIKVENNLDQKLFWADLHGQSEETVGTNDVNDYFRFARESAGVDIAGHQGNDSQITDKFWRKLNQVTKKVTKDNEFVAFPGYEWSGNTPKGGDRNVLFLNEDEQIIRSSHALLDDFSDITCDALTAKDLFKKLKDKKALTIAHVGGRYADLRTHDDCIEPVIEIHSAWGTFEWFLFEALNRGYKVGVVANGDGHTGRPGAESPSFAHFNTLGGLTGIYVKKLDRKTVFEALKKRHCYGTTGARIYLDVGVEVDGKCVGMMGDEIEYKKNMKLKVDCVGTDALERVEIFNLDQIIGQVSPTCKDKRGKQVKILWSGSSVKGRSRAFKWEGKLNVRGVKIKSLEKINFYNQNNFVKTSGDSIEFNGMTTGGVQGLILSLEKNEGEIKGKINGKKIKIKVKDILSKPRVTDFGGLDAKLKIYQTQSEITRIKFETEVKTVNKGANPVFVKVVQRDGHMAWSSPIFLTSIL